MSFLQMCKPWNITDDYLRVTIGGSELANPNEVRDWYDFGSISTIYLSTPEFPEIKRLPKWVIDCVIDTYTNNPTIKYDDSIALDLFSAAPDFDNIESYLVWHCIKLRKVLVEKIVVSPIEKLSNDNDDLILETDSSENTWSAVLKRKEDKKEEICRYTSGTFTVTEERYHINEKEFLAVIKGLKKFSYFLLPKRFLLRVDNTQVKAFIKNNLPSKPEYKRLIRWQCMDYPKH